MILRTNTSQTPSGSACFLCDVFTAKSEIIHSCPLPYDFLLVSLTPEPWQGFKRKHSLNHKHRNSSAVVGIHLKFYTRAAPLTNGKNGLYSFFIPRNTTVLNAWIPFRLCSVSFVSVLFACLLYPICKCISESFFCKRRYLTEFIAAIIKSTKMQRTLNGFLMLKREI